MGTLSNDDPTALLTYDQILDLFNNTHIPPDPLKKAITADTAMQGADKMVLTYWEGFVATTIKVIPKSDGKEVIDAIESMANSYGVQKSRIVYDADGVGNFVGGFLQGAKAFHNGGKALKDENYKNLKTQCIYKFCERASAGGGGHKMVASMFTHGLGDAANFSTAYTELLTHPKNTNQNRLWVPSTQELLEYFHVKDNSVITKSVSGSKITITIDQSAVHHNVRNRGMSLLLSGLNIVSIDSVSGVDELTFNVSTGLINIYKQDTSKTVNPALEVQPPKVLAFIKSGNNTVDVYYDKVVTQSVASAYTLTGKGNVTSVTGNGTNYTITYASAIGDSDTITYSARYGNAVAVETKGKRLTDYLGFPISPAGTTPPVIDPTDPTDPSDGEIRQFIGRRIIMIT